MNAGSITGFAVGLVLAGGLVAWNLGGAPSVTTPGAAVVQAAAPSVAPPAVVASPAAKAGKHDCCKNHGSVHAKGDWPHEKQTAAKKECPFLRGDVAAKDAAAKKDAPARNDAPAATHACPMHPEVKGGPNDRCPECGMLLDKV